MSSLMHLNPITVYFTSTYQNLCGPCGNEIVVASFLQHFGISKAAAGLKLVYHILTSAKTKRAKQQFFSLSGSQVQENNRQWRRYPITHNVHKVSGTYHNFIILFILLTTLLSCNSCLAAQTTQAPKNEHTPTALLSSDKIMVGSCKVNRNVW